MNGTIKNAEIVSTKIGYDHGCLCAWVFLDGSGWGCGFGGHVFDNYDKDLGRRVATTGYGIEYIKKILDTVGVENWENLKGKYVRAETQGISQPITRIGHITEDKWFDPKELKANERS